MREVEIERGRMGALGNLLGMGGGGGMPKPAELAKLAQQMPGGLPRGLSGGLPGGLPGLPPNFPGAGPPGLPGLGGKLPGLGGMPGPTKKK